MIVRELEFKIKAEIFILKVNQAETSMVTHQEMINDFKVLGQATYSITQQKPSNSNNSRGGGGNQNPEVLPYVIQKAYFQRKILRYAKEQEKASHSWNKKQSIKTVTECQKMLHIADKYFKAAIINLRF